MTSRELKTGSKYDQDFVPGKDLYMWVSVFDHTQTRHTRHAAAGAASSRRNENVRASGRVS